MVESCRCCRAWRCRIVSLGLSLLLAAGSALAGCGESRPGGWKLGEMDSGSEDAGDSQVVDADDAEEARPKDGSLDSDEGRDAGLDSDDGEEIGTDSCEPVGGATPTTHWGGGPIEGRLDVRVVRQELAADSPDGRIPEAHVMVGEAPEPKAAGRTDEKGRIVFEDPTLQGPVRLTVVGPGHTQNVSIVDLDASQATIALHSYDLVSHSTWPRVSSGEVHGLSDIEPSGGRERVGWMRTARKEDGCCRPRGGIDHEHPFSEDPAGFELAANNGPSLFVALGGTMVVNNDNPHEHRESFEPTRMGLFREETSGCSDRHDLELALDEPLDRSVTVAFDGPGSETPRQRSVHARFEADRHGTVAPPSLATRGDGQHLELGALPDIASLPTLELTLEARTESGPTTSVDYIRGVNSTAHGITAEPLPATRIALPNGDDDNTDATLPRSGSLADDGEGTSEGWVTVELFWRPGGNDSGLPSATQLILPGDTKSYRFPKLPAGVVEQRDVAVYPSDSARLNVDRILPNSLDYQQLEAEDWSRHNRDKWTHWATSVTVPDDF